MAGQAPLCASPHMHRPPAAPLTPPQNHSILHSFGLLQHQSEAQPISFHQLEHSYAEKGGCLPAAVGHQERFSNFGAPLAYPDARSVSAYPPLNLSPLFSYSFESLTKQRTSSPFDSYTFAKSGGGGCRT